MVLEQLQSENGVWNCLEGNTMSTPVHTSETRMCGDLDYNSYTAWRAVHREITCVKANQVQPSRLVGVVVVLYPRASSPSSSMHLGSSLWSGAMRSPHSIAFQAIMDFHSLNILKYHRPHKFIELTLFRL